VAENSLLENSSFVEHAHVDVDVDRYDLHYYFQMVDVIIIVNAVSHIKYHRRFLAQINETDTSTLSFPQIIIIHIKIIVHFGDHG
jgi:hypothetical protein